MITVLTPVSSIKSHPETHILDETIESVRYHWPDAEIMLMFDGVRAEHEHRRADYEEHIRRVLWKSDHDPLWRPVCPYVFDEHIHQIGMMRAVIDDVRTPLVLFVEQDTPLVTDEPIDWHKCCELIFSEEADLVRLHSEAQVLAEHRHLMRERHGDFLRTVQFSARPHLAARGYYERVLEKCFSPHANCFLEDLLHSPAQSYPDEHKMWIYHPDTGNIKRSYHTDGRAGEPKYADTQIF